MTESFSEPDYDGAPCIVDGDVEVRWDDGSVSALPGLWLREFSPDLGTIHPVTREQLLMLMDLPEDLRAVAAQVLPDGRLAVTWQPEGMMSHYHPGWLWAHRPESPAGSGLPPRRLWQPGRAPHRAPVRVEGSAIRAGDEAALDAWLTALHVEGLSIVERLPPDPDVVPEIPHLIGCLRNSDFGETWEVQSSPDADSNAFTTVALAPHTDMCTRECVPGLQFLFCLHNSCSGGDSTFVDGYAVAEQRRAESAADLEVLASVPVPVQAPATRTPITASTFRCMELDAAGDLSTPRYTWWQRKPTSGDSAIHQGVLRRHQAVPASGERPWPPYRAAAASWRHGLLRQPPHSALPHSASIRRPADAGCAAATSSVRSSSHGCRMLARAERRSNRWSAVRGRRRRPSP